MRVRLEDLSRSFGGIEVLKAVSFNDSIDKLAIIGPSGGGKSTLLRIIGGLLAPSSGRVFIDGEEVDYDEKKLPRYRAQLGYVFQQNGLFSHLSARKNISIPIQMVHGVSEK
ncbi:MAG: ATP-binding cassette domain-containing protein, partial [Eggerthellaceae bacterium]|nr:ATP-binding cassette domain-containing protein [Eggerthellaceae bacterium]